MAARRRLRAESGRNRELLRNFPKLRNPCGLMAAGPLLAGTRREAGNRWEREGWRARGAGGRERDQGAEGGSRRGDH